MSAEKTSQRDAPTGEPRRADGAETVKSGPESSQRLSDVVLAESQTGAAPSFREPAPVPRPAIGPDALTAPHAARERPAAAKGPLAMLPGTKVDDFEIVKMLGRGAFGHVYLARQISLDRFVALKVSANRGSEGRTMARLEHQHIVQVFSEKVEPEFNQRLLCMQLVPGIGLEKLIGALHSKPAGGAGAAPAPWTGGELLAIIDRTAALPAALDPSALHDREALGRMDSVEATAWFGGRLAEALDFAHRHGVLHRDIKPANILVNPYGRPLLADFNISSQPLGASEGEEMFGGTFAYMAPEHLDAFNPTVKDVGPDAVTARSDQFSLGLVLQQLLDGQLHFALPARNDNLAGTLREMAADRRQHRRECAPGPPGARQTLQRTIGRCLAPDPADRFVSGAELAEQLDGCRQLRQSERRLPSPPTLLAPVLRRPFLWLIALVVLPQVLGSAVNITYNVTQIVGKLAQPQQAMFDTLVIAYNAIVYPVAILLFVLAVRPVWRCWRALENAEPIPEGAVTAARQRALSLPGWIAALTALGWFPGGVLFPAVIAAATPPLEFRLAAHFFVSFYLSGLIALAYSLCGAQFVVLRALYPGMWRDVRSFSARAGSELAPMNARFWQTQILAGLIPLVAAVLLLGLGSEAPDRLFRWLVVGMIVLGAVGFQLTSIVIRGLTDVVAALSGAKA
jgi:serine/threonine protein kinase